MNEITTNNEFSLLTNMDYENNRVTVDGRLLHEMLGVSSKYNDWIKRMIDYGFKENEDFVLVTQKKETNNPKNPITEFITHQLTLDMAKQIAMVTRNEKGMAIRKYFIEVEKMWNDPTMVMNRALQMSSRQLAQLQNKCNELQIELLDKKQIIEEQAPKVKFHDDMEISETSVLVRSLANIYKEKDVKFIIVDGAKCKLGEKKLREWFKEKSYMNKSVYASEKNRPTQRAVELGVMEEKISTRTNGEDTYTNYTTYITSKGIKYFMDRIVKEVSAYDMEEIGA